MKTTLCFRRWWSLSRVEEAQPALWVAVLQRGQRSILILESSGAPNPLQDCILMSWVFLRAGGRPGRVPRICAPPQRTLTHSGQVHRHLLSEQTRGRWSISPLIGFDVLTISGPGSLGWNRQIINRRNTVITAWISLGITMFLLMRTSKSNDGHCYLF